MLRYRGLPARAPHLLLPARFRANAQQILHDQLTLGAQGIAGVYQACDIIPGRVSFRVAPGAAG